MSDYKETLSNFGAAALVWFTHAALVFLVLLTFHIIELIMIYFWGDNGKLLWANVPMSYLFDSFDVVALITLFFYGMYHLVKAYKGRKSNDE